MMCGELVLLLRFSLLGRDLENLEQFFRQRGPIDSPFPGRSQSINAFCLGGQPRFGFGQTSSQANAVPLAADMSRFEHGWFAVIVFGRIKNGEDLVILLMGKGVIFVAVTLGTTISRSHPDLHRGVHPIHDGGMPVLFRVRTPFCIVRRIPMETTGNPLRISRLGKQVSGEHFDRELIVGLIGIQGFDQPVAPSPNRPRGIVNIPLRITIASQIQPDRSPAFAVSRGSEQAIDQTLERIRSIVCEKRLRLVQRRRQPGQIE